MEHVNIVQEDPKVSYIKDFVAEIESSICDKITKPNPNHILPDDVRDYLVQRELGYLYHHIMVSK